MAVQEKALKNKDGEKDAAVQAAKSGMQAMMTTQASLPVPGATSAGLLARGACSISCLEQPYLTFCAWLVFHQRFAFVWFAFGL